MIFLLTNSTLKSIRMNHRDKEISNLEGRKLTKTYMKQKIRIALCIIIFKTISIWEIKRLFFIA